MELPRHLAPWSAELSLFSEEIAAALGGLVSRLALLIGEGAPRLAHGGDPDGYDGLTRRGPFDRLLSSEWLLLDELPEEFLRRATSGELCYLRRAHARPLMTRPTVALFDAGPQQLGAPRLAQLAILIVLAQRAARQGTSLVWSAAQGRDAGARVGLDAASVKSLLEARSRIAPVAEDLDAALARLDPKAEAERWVVAGPRLTRVAAERGLSTVCIEEVLTVEAPWRLRVSVRSPGPARPREALLELPAERLAVQVLRDPFARARPAASSGGAIAAGSSLLFAPDDRRLYARADGASVISFPMVNSPRAPAGKPVRSVAPSGQTVIGVGRRHRLRKAIVLCQDGPDLVAHTLSRRGVGIIASDRYVPREGYVAPPASSRDPLRPVAVLDDEALCFIDGAGERVELRDGGVWGAGPTGAVCARCMGEGLVWALAEDDRPVIRYVYVNGPGPFRVATQSLPSSLPEALRRVHGGSILLGKGVSNVFTYQTRPRVWVVVDPRGVAEVEVAPDLDVVGVLHPSNAEGRARLVALDEAKTRLLALTPAGPEVLVTTVDPIVSVAVDHVGWQVAALTQASRLVVYSAVAGAVVLRHVAGEPDV